MEIVTKNQEAVLMVEGHRIPMVEKVVLRSRREWKPVEGYGSVQPSEHRFGRVSHEIEFHRARIATNRGFELLDVFDLSDFEVTLERDGITAVFSGCNWIEVEECLSEKDRLIQKAVLVAKERRSRW